MGTKENKCEELVRNNKKASEELKEFRYNLAVRRALYEMAVGGVILLILGVALLFFVGMYGASNIYSTTIPYSQFKTLGLNFTPSSNITSNALINIWSDNQPIGVDVLNMIGGGVFGLILTVTGAFFTTLSLMGGTINMRRKIKAEIYGKGE